MKYSEFIYQAARAGADYGDSSMNYEAFLLGKMEEEEDFAGYLDRTYHEANAFLQRINALGKIPCKIAEFEPFGDSAPVLSMGEDFLKPMAVFQFRDAISKNDYESLPFKKVGKKVTIVGRYSPYRKTFCQYRVKLPVFGKADIAWIDETEGIYYVGGLSYDTFAEALEAAEARQVDLEELYGITDEILTLGVDWVRARLRDDISKGHSEEIEAETRLNDIESDEFIYLQTTGGKSRI